MALSSSPLTSSAAHLPLRYLSILQGQIARLRGQKRSYAHNQQEGGTCRWFAITRWREWMRSSGCWLMGVQLSWRADRSVNVRVILRLSGWRGRSLSRRDLSCIGGCIWWSQWWGRQWGCWCVVRYGIGVRKKEARLSILSWATQWWNDVILESYVGYSKHNILMGKAWYINYERQVNYMILVDERDSICS